MRGSNENTTAFPKREDLSKMGIIFGPSLQEEVASRDERSQEQQERPEMTRRTDLPSRFNVWEYLVAGSRASSRLRMVIGKRVKRFLERLALPGGGAQW
jgi:hypothetical protein